MNYISIITSIVLSLLFIGFLIGFWRNWQRSLVRFGILFACLIFSIFITPVLSKALLGKFVSGTTFSALGFTVNFEELVRGFLGEEFAKDLMSANATTTQLATSLLNVVINIISFLLIFFVLMLLTFIVYGIVSVVVSAKNKKKGSLIEKDAKYWWLRVLGGGIGLLSSVIVCFALLTPVFGVMGVCDKFLETETQQTASAASSKSYLCGELYYTEDENIGQVEGYIQKYADIKAVYNKSFIGGLFNFTGISKAGTATFNHLTNVNSGGLKVNVTNELVAIVKVYNLYKENFIKNKFDLASNDSIDAALAIYDMANESEIVKSYIKELVPKFCEKWIAGEKFLGIEMPIKGEFQPIAKHVLGVFNTTNIMRLNTNVKALAGIVKVANNNELIENVRNNVNLVDYLANNETFVKEEILQLATTQELKQVMPKILNDFMEIAYKEVVGGTADFSEMELTNEQIDAIVWEDEANALQGLSNSLLDVYVNIKDSSDASSMAGQLSNIGKAIDKARDSVILNKPFQVFIEDFVKSDKVKLSDDVKASLLKPIAEKNLDGTINEDCKWNDETYSFETTFAAVGEAAKVAQSIVNGMGDISIDSLSSVLKDVIKNEDFKDTINEIIESDAIANMLGNNEASNVLTDMVSTIVNSANTDEDIDNAIVAGQEIVNIINDSKNSGELKLSGSTQEEKQAEADKIVENIASSNIVMNLINNDSASAQGIAKNLGGDASVLKNAIDTNENITIEQKAILNKLFA